MNGACFVPSATRRDLSGLRLLPSPREAAKAPHPIARVVGYDAGPARGRKPDTLPLLGLRFPEAQDDLYLTRVREPGSDGIP